MTSSVRLREFDIWREGYAGSIVDVYVGATTTHAALYLDAALTIPTTNPQNLLTFTDVNGRTYGKWAQPLYTNSSYHLLIDATNQTGIEFPPLTTATALNVSGSIFIPRRGGWPQLIEDLADRNVWVPNYGGFSESEGSAVCTATLQAAVGAAAANDGGYVLVPAGSFPITALDLPQGVILRGAGPAATSLRSLNAGDVLTLSGDGAGLADLTLDGLNLVSGSTGVYGVDVVDPVFENVLIQRFDVGVRLRGASNGLWRNLSVLTCNTGLHLRGDSDTGATGAGAEIENIRWEGGRVSLHTTDGLLLDFFDKAVRNVAISGVSFEGNTGVAAKLNGARFVSFDECVWDGNITNLLMQDDTNLALVALNTVECVQIRGGRMVGGKLTFNGTCADVVLRNMKMEGASYDLTIPTHPIVLLDVIEDAATTSTGDTTKILRGSETDRGVVAGITGDGSTVTAWSQLLDPGATLLLEVKAIARQRNGINSGIFRIQAGASRPGATLNASLVTTTFVAGARVQGATSGASARITAVSGTTGTAVLTLRDISGVFLNGEQLTDDNTGSGRCAGSLVYADAALDGTGVTTMRAATVTGGVSWAITIDCLGGQVRVQITGQAGHIVEWTISLEITEP